jgi:hypothetical protein
MRIHNLDIVDNLIVIVHLKQNTYTNFHNTS